MSGPLQQAYSIQTLDIEMPQSLCSQAPFCAIHDSIDTPQCIRLKKEPASPQINIEYNISYIYHSLYAFFDRDNIGLPGKPSSRTQQAPFVSLSRGCFS